ncbi:MAG: AAA family ATPase, partial [Roseburia sp.]|nr:AAA family ATPase [Roseburia sp.]
LITRPRRFGKTLTMSMVEQFFSVNYVGRNNLFERQAIWQKEKFRDLQGSWPVISLSFSDVKASSFEQARNKICFLIQMLYKKYDFLLESNLLDDREKEAFRRVSPDMEDYEASFSLKLLSDYLCRYYKKKVIILLDEYDTPMQEAYVDGYWDKMIDFIRSLFNSTFKTNPWLERAILTGITRISKESVFSDLNNLEVVTTTSNKYATSFGFTEKEVFDAMDEYGYTNKGEVKEWYDGFVFGKERDIYNPWSILNFLSKGDLDTYWANTSSNQLVNKLVREGAPEIKITMEDLLHGKPLRTQIDEQIVFNQLNHKTSAIWSLLVASGYLKVVNITRSPKKGKPDYELALTNMEVRFLFEDMINGWFADFTPAYNQFIEALLLRDVKAMNSYMNRVALQTFSYFDTGNRPSEKEPERFYHGFVLGLIVELEDRYTVTSNRESGFGRYDVVLEPLKKEDFAYILEFKVHDPDKEETLKDTVAAALEQIDDKKYETTLLAKGIPAEKIQKYGVAFEEQTVLIG